MNGELIRNQLIFAGLADEDIDWLLKMSALVTFPKGDRMIEEGSVGDALYFIVEGEVKVVKLVGASEVVLAHRGAGEVMGEMALIDECPRNASVDAVTDLLVYKIHKDVFFELISTRPKATLAILRTIMSRLRNTEAGLRQQEKMASLGTLAAGLAHELNNPAAAAQRASAHLRDLLLEWQPMTQALGALMLDPDQQSLVESLRQKMTEGVKLLDHSGALARSDREQALERWLESQSIERAWEAAPALAAFGWTEQDLADLRTRFSDSQFNLLVQWMAKGQAIYALLQEITIGASRMTEIVKAVKSYAYLDQAPIQEINIHEGLDDTLVILRSKLKSGIEVQRDYSPDLPRIEAYGSELNQVWTNIIDNAISAMQGKGNLVIRTYFEEDCVNVEITDNGKGIPPEVQPRIFDPFYTTKPPGEGSGMGLNIAYNIIQKHRGQIRVNSKPGETTFKVSLPTRSVPG